MVKMAFHPGAYLREKKNVRRGLASRTKVLDVLERQSSTVSVVAKEAKLSYNVVFHHLQLLEAEKIVSRKKIKKPHRWKLTGSGQQRL